MNKHLLLLISIVFAVSCSTIKSGEKICHKNLKTIQSISWSEGLLVNSHLKLKKSNYFDYYQAVQVLLDSKIKKTGYRGSYSRLNDTLFFHFCGDTIPKLLTQKALINKLKNEIVLLSSDPRLNHRFAVRFNKYRNL